MILEIQSSNTPHEVESWEKVSHLLKQKSYKERSLLHNDIPCDSIHAQTAQSNRYPRCLHQASLPQLEKASFPTGPAALIRENAIDPVTQSEIEILARSTKVAQSFPAAGITAVALAAVLAPARP